MNKIYPFGYNSAAIDIMMARNAADNAKVFIKHVTPGMHILDVGCGPGSITVGLGKALYPSKIIGIDKEDSQIKIAQDLATQKGVNNCSFNTASIFELPYDDNSFDAVYGHTILMQFDKVDRALSEIKRVLKPGGIIGFREVDFSSNVFYPDESALKEMMMLFRKSFIHNECNPDIGRSLASTLNQQGFKVKEFLASYSQPTTNDEMEKMYDSMISLWQQAEFPNQAVELGWISEEKSRSLPDRLRKESMLPGNIHAVCFVEVVAINE